MICNNVINGVCTVDIMYCIIAILTTFIIMYILRICMYTCIINGVTGKTAKMATKNKL